MNPTKTEAAFTLGYNDALTGVPSIHVPFTDKEEDQAYYAGWEAASEAIEALNASN
jgi:ribosome modulation factor